MSDSDYTQAELDDWFSTKDFDTQQYILTSGCGRRWST